MTLCWWGRKLSASQIHQLKPSATRGFLRVLLLPCVGPTESSSHLHVTVELKWQALMLHLNRLRAGLPRLRAASTVMQNHLQVLLLVLKEDIWTAASQLEILPIKGHNVPGRAAHAHTWTGESKGWMWYYPNSHTCKEADVTKSHTDK